MLCGNILDRLYLQGLIFGSHLWLVLRLIQSKTCTRYEKMCITNNVYPGIQVILTRVSLYSANEEQKAYNLVCKPEKLFDYQIQLFNLNLLGVRLSSLRWSLTGRLAIYFFVISLGPGVFSQVYGMMIMMILMNECFLTSHSVGKEKKKAWKVTVLRVSEHIFSMQILSALCGWRYRCFSCFSATHLLGDNGQVDLPFSHGFFKAYYDPLRLDLKNSIWII